MNHFPALALVASLCIPQAFANCAVLKDHVSDARLFDGQPILLQSYPTSLSRTVLAGAAAAFVGDGGVLKSVGGVFATEGANGEPNEGDLGSTSYRVSFFDSLDEYLADPYGESLQEPSVLQRFNQPTNDDWLTPIGTSDQGHNYLYWEFDVESLGIKTTAGKTQLAMIHPVGVVFSGLTYMAFSKGGENAIGDASDYFRSDLIDLGPDQLSELDAPTPYAAYRIETVVPEPTSVTILLFLLVGYAGKTSRSKSRN